MVATITDPLVPQGLHDVPKTYDGGDINAHGQWCGEDMCCLTCRETAPMCMGLTTTYLLASLECGECGETFAQTWWN